jgi:hypothetical protein
LCEHPYVLVSSEAGVPRAANLASPASRVNVAMQ